MKPLASYRRAALRLVVLSLAACGGPLVSVGEPEPSAAVASSEPPHSAPLLPTTVTAAATPPVGEARSEEDRALDPSRHPAEMISFFHIALGQRVGELGSGTGYTTELLARAVGPTGAVYGENPKWLLEKSAEGPWSERLRKPVMRNVARIDREFDDPFPPEIHDLDAVVAVLFYHDTVWLGTDRDRMNRAAFAALRPGGIYGIIDMSAAPNRGVRDVKTVHRIEESFVKTEVVKAGFRFVDEGGFLRNPTDRRDWNDTPSAPPEKRGTSDRFVLEFVKP